MTGEEWARLSTNPALTYTAHAAPMQMVFYTGDQFPAEYRGDAFVAMHGSWNRGTPSGYEVVRIRFKKGTPTKIEPFLTGFLTTAGGRPATYGRPVGLAVARDGALLVSDDAGGRIYRIAYAGGTMTIAQPAAEPPPAVGTSGTRDEESGGVIAMERTETRAESAFSVTSPAFQPGSAIQCRIAATVSASRRRYTGAKPRRARIRSCC
jgi:hypothetical protein